MPTATKPRRMCRHCQRHGINRPRSLCWGCYRNPAIRDQYAARTNQHGAALGLGLKAPTKPASQPCPARGGTPERMAAMCERMERGEELFHPLDGHDLTL